MTSFLRACLLMLLLGPACLDPGDYPSDTQPSWMEWPAEVRAGESFPIRVVAYPGLGCRRAPPLRVDVEQRDSSITLHVLWILRNGNIRSSDAGCFDAFPYVDTLVPVRSPSVPTDRRYAIDIIPPWRGLDTLTGELLDTVITVGTVLVRAGAPSDTSRTVGGAWVQGFRNEAGCSMIIVPNQGHTLVTNPPELPWDGWVTGHHVPTPAPECGPLAFHIDRFIPTPNRTVNSSRRLFDGR
jgi:hypothetical protein